MNKEVPSDIHRFIGALKQTILQSQYVAAKQVNKQLVQLYYFLGASISKKVEQANWGDKVLETISAELQKELKHLKGFSAGNLKKMRRFYDAYPAMLSFCPLANKILLSTETEVDVNWSTVSTELTETFGSTVSTQIEKAQIPVLGNAIEEFWNISFSNHMSIINKLNVTEDRIWFIQQTAKNNWSNRVLENHLRNRIHKQPQFLNNFDEQLPEQTKIQAIAQFRDEYLLDFISIEDSDDERLIENKIVENIKAFLLNLGTGFSFIGNQYKLTVNGDEFFIDLLFFNRNLQAMVAVELKRGKFKPEHIGQLGFYLSVLDEQVRLPHENPSIGIILCKEKNNTVVEFALRNANQPMGVAVYKTKNEMPENLKKVLPGADELKKLIQ